MRSRRVGDTAGEDGRIPSRRNAAALHADLDLDEAAELDIEVLCHPGGCIDLLGESKQSAIGITRARQAGANYDIADDLIAHKDVRHAAAHQGFRLADLWTH